AEAQRAHTPGPQNVPPPEFAPDTEIAGHRIIEYAGGNAVTAWYKAAQTSMGRNVLFTMLQPKHAADEDTKAAFFAEARSIARLNHPNLLSVFDMGEENGVCFFTTEFVDGGALPQFVARADKASSEERVSIATQIGRSLAYAQSAGVQELWIGPEDVLLTDKSNVRISHVGTSAPLRGGTPEPIMNVLVRLMYVVAAGKDLPRHLRKPGAAASVGMPVAHDPLGGKFNALVSTLLADAATYGNVAEFASELEKLWESARRRSAISASAAPSGIVPIRLEKARRRQLSVTAIVITTAIATVLCGGTLWAVLDHINTTRANKEAGELWDKAREQLATRETRMAALRSFEKLAKDYAKTEYGKRAKKEGIEKAKIAIVSDYYGEAAAKFADKPRDTEKAIAEIRAAEEELKSILPNYALVHEQAEVRVKNVGVRYARTAGNEWRVTVRKIQSYSGRGQYGKGLAEARSFIEKWSEPNRAAAAAKTVIKQVEGLAEKRYEEIKRRADKLAAEGKMTQATNELEWVIRNFGIPKYEKMARESLDKLDRGD
ncbi:MAG: protein kinase, partial [Planctomycetota bacterium]